MRLLSNAVILLAFAATARAALPVELELATERGVQITAPHEWLQLLAGLGIDNVRIREIRLGDEPQVSNRGTGERPRYHVVGILTARHQLQLPGGSFSRSDRGRLKDYFDRLTADGAEALTAPRGWFGLTEQEMSAVLADLTQLIDFETQGQPAADVVQGLQATFALKLAIGADAAAILRTAHPVRDELQGLTAGTGLAMLLRPYGLVLRPEKTRGQPVVYRVEAGGSVALSSAGLPVAAVGKTTDDALPHWPVGWEPQHAPGELAPSLFEFRNAEIEGYTLQETLSAIGPRVKVPLYLDHAALAKYQIDPAKIQVRLARTRTIYKRVIDRVLAQARLGSELRVDEAGRPFLWITR